MRFRSNVERRVPFQTNRSTRLPSSGTSRITSESAPSSGVSAHGIERREERIRRRRREPCSSRRGRRSCSARNSGWSAMPSSPRSEKLFTPRSSTVAPIVPFWTRRTWPVIFSMTNHSVFDRNATPIGVDEAADGGTDREIGDRHGGGRRSVLSRDEGRQKKACDSEQGTESKPATVRPPPAEMNVAHGNLRS